MVVRHKHVRELGEAPGLDFAQYVAGAVGVALAALAELFTQKIRLDDNISVTLACAIGMTVAEFALAA
jgi:multisubunit Na+/H+ antiporter MnhB subunit